MCRVVFPIGAAPDGPMQNAQGFLRRRAPLAIILALAVPGLALAGPRSAPTRVATTGAKAWGSVTRGSVDWFVFTAAAGARYTIRTQDLSFGMDTVITVYDPNLAAVGRDDDSGGGRASKLDLTAAKTGDYLIAATHYYRRSSGTFSLTVLGPPPAPLPPTPPTPTPPPPPPPPPTPPTPTPTPTPVPPPTRTPTPTATLTLDVPPVADPRLDDGAGQRVGVALGLQGDGAATSYDARITVLSGATTVRTVSTGAHPTAVRWNATWDGKDDLGRPVAPGAYVVRFDASGPIAGRAERPVTVVRLGARAVKFLDTGAGEPRVPLAFHAASGSPRSYFAVDAAGPHWTLARSSLGDGALDEAAGATLASPAPWTGLAAPPKDSAGRVLDRGRSLPIAYQSGGRMRVEALLGDKAYSPASTVAVGCGYPVTGFPIRVNAGGAPSAAVSPGAAVQVEVGALAPSGLGREDRTVELRFEYQDATGTWRAIAGVQKTRHTLYTLAGGSKLSSSGGPSTDARQMPFVNAVDDLFSWTTPGAPRPTTALEVAELVTRAVYERKGLTYDTVAGASQYADGSLDAPDLAFSEFLSGKARGSIVNCSDCAALVSVYTRTAGVDCESYILGWNFGLNYIKGIGATVWKKDIFNNGFPAFYYHAVGSLSQGRTIHDACLAVDDGPRPDTVEPRVERLPIDMPFDRYRKQLSPDQFQIQSHGRPSQN